MNKHQTTLLAGLSALALAATTACAPNAAVQPVEHAQPAVPPAPCRAPKA